jgi:hypothetical protein
LLVGLRCFSPHKILIFISAFSDELAQNRLLLLSRMC